MTEEQYKKLINSKKPKEKRFNNALISFLVGGLIGLLSEALSCYLVYNFSLSKQDSYKVVCLITIMIASLFTAMGFFDNLVLKYKSGLIVPTTGFAHSVASSALEYKKDGMVTGLGSNVFKLAGSVILYGIVSAFFLCILRVIIWQL